MRAWCLRAAARRPPYVHLLARPHVLTVATRQLCAPPPPPASPPSTAQPFTDINKDSLAHRLLPASAWPYAALGRWDRPIGTWLLLWPCFWSTALAAPAGALPDASLLALFSVGAFAMRGAGCTINDLWDRDIDRQVERTRNRPLASGALGVPQALGFLGVQLSAGLAVLLALPPYAVGLGLVSVPLFSLYPLAKRYTGYPQAVLGLTFNWGALMGMAATHGSAMAWPAVLPLYVGGFWWTLMYAPPLPMVPSSPPFPLVPSSPASPRRRVECHRHLNPLATRRRYDTIYAHQDKEDDARVGVRSTALTLGDDKRYLAAFSALSVGTLALAGSGPVELHPAFYVGLLAGGGAHLTWQVATVDLASRADCLRKFQSNHYFGMALFAALVAGRLLLEPESREAEEGVASARPGVDSNDGRRRGGDEAPPAQPRTVSLLLDYARGK